jgi:hypothetical protein
MSDRTKTVYEEYNAARQAVEGMRMVNAYSLDTPEKQLAWDVAYDKANARLFKASAERAKLVQEMATK